MRDWVGYGRRGRHRMGSGVGAVVDALESRRMLSAAAAAIHGHVLVVEGTRGGDQIGVSKMIDGTAAVSVGGRITATFQTSAFDKIRIKGGKGADNIYVDCPVRAILFGGDGDDTLYGGGGRDTLLGEAGDDELYGFAGNDLIQGGGGNDSASGGDGDDKVFGDGGADTLEGNLGDDLVSGGPGDDTVWEGPGTDRVFGNRGHDHFKYTFSSKDLRDEDDGDVVEYVPTSPPQLIVGSFDYDGGVTFNDLVKLSQDYNTSLPATPVGSQGSLNDQLLAAFEQMNLEGSAL